MNQRPTWDSFGDAGQTAAPPVIHLEPQIVVEPAEVKVELPEQTPKRTRTIVTERDEDHNIKSFETETVAG